MDPREGGSQLPVLASTAFDGSVRDLRVSGRSRGTSASMVPAGVGSGPKQPLELLGPGSPRPPLEHVDKRVLQVGTSNMPSLRPWCMGSLTHFYWHGEVVGVGGNLWQCGAQESEQCPLCAASCCYALSWTSGESTHTRYGDCLDLAVHCLGPCKSPHWKPASSAFCGTKVGFQHKAPERPRG